MESVTPNSGPTSGGTSVTINGTNFLSDATVKFDATTAANINVVSSTTITATAPAHAAGPVNVVVTNTNGLSGALTNGYTYTQTITEVIIVEDNFNDNSLDLAKWMPNNVFSGFTDSSVPTRETNQNLQIGPLLLGQSGSHYNGVRSVNGYDFTNAYGYVELVQAPASTTKADAMFTIGRDPHNYYRVYVEEGVFICQARIAGTKRNLLTAAYSPTTDRYWRIRRDQSTGNVVFETATDNAGVPGSWTVRYSERWDTTAVPPSAVIFELKAGTWQVESVAPGLIVFDNFKAARM